MLGAAAAAWSGPGLAGAAEVRVILADHEGVVKEIARHRGKVVVLDCWSTSCPPCVKEFPGLVRLADAHPDDVVCLSLALDYDGIGAPDDVLPPVREFLERVGGRRVIHLLATEEADVMHRKLGLTGVPAVSIWRPDGSLAIRYDEDHAARMLGRSFTYDDVEATVTEILAEARR